MARIALIVSLLTALLALFGFFQWAWAEWKAHRVRKKVTWLVVLAICIAPSVSEATTWPAATCENKAGQLDVQDAIDLASSGDTVTVPAGTCTWGFPVHIRKDIKFQGAGIDQTIFIDPGTYSAVGGSFVNHCIIGVTPPCTGFAAMLFVAYDDGFATVVDVSGFTIKSYTNAVTSAANYLVWVIGNGIAKFRIHHIACKPQNLGDNSAERCVTDYSDDAGLSYHSGLVDHVYCSVPTNGGICFNTRTSVFAGAAMWKHTLELGTNKSTYFEDNECYFPSADADGCYDMYDGASYVWRYNTNTRGGQGNHGADSSAYGQFITEIYRNTNTNPGSHQVSPSDPGRGSFQIMFDETSFGLYDRLSNIRIYRSEATNPSDIYTGDGVNDTFPISFTFPNGPQVGVTETVIATGVRTRKTYTTDYSVVGTDVIAVTPPPATVTWTLHRAPMGKPGFPCDFETTWDLNLGTAGQSNLGYPCLHQVGWAWPAPVGCTNEATCGVANGANAVYNPTYMWGNTIEGVKTGTIGTYQAAGYPAGYVHINSATSPSLIDIYTDTDGVACTPGGSCTVGVGIGTTLPTTCTTASGPNGGIGGVGFWKTDEGLWNQSGDGRGSGILYKCTATNTWTVYYTPYTYPHPLQGAEAGADQSPTHVVVARVLRWMEILLPIAGLGFQFRRAVATSVGVVLACSMTAGITTLSMTKRVTTVAAVKVLTLCHDCLKPKG